MSKLHICGITMAGKKDLLKSLLEPLYPYYDSLNWVFHKPSDEGFDYLESVKKDGKIQLIEFCERLDFSRNHYLFNGTMKTGDYFISLDDLEILKPEFFLKWPILRHAMETQNVDGAVLHGKRFLFRYSEFLHHIGNPHEGIRGASRIIELSEVDGFQNTDDYFGSRRSEKRDKYEFVEHYLKYYFYPGSNHCQLGCPDMERLKKRELLRREFRVYCDYYNLLPMTPDKFKWLCDNKMDDIKKFINEEKILNDAYRLFVLKREDFNDDHDHNNMVKV